MRHTRQLVSASVRRRKRFIDRQPVHTRDMRPLLRPTCQYLCLGSETYMRVPHRSLPSQLRAANQAHGHPAARARSIPAMTSHAAAAILWSLRAPGRRRRVCARSMTRRGRPRLLRARRSSVAAIPARCSIAYMTRSEHLTFIL